MTEKRKTLSTVINLDLDNLACDLAQANDHDDVIAFIKAIDEYTADYDFTFALCEYFKCEIAKEDAVDEEES